MRTTREQGAEPFPAIPIGAVLGSIPILAGKLVEILGHLIGAGEHVCGQAPLTKIGHDLRILAHLRESQAYIRAAESGLGIFELAPSQVWQDVPGWDPVFDWLNRG